ncbi:MAG: hypothetical protein CVU16_04230 [Betaproteobacteria bacterium HGW-Betaproteobacteria-10]|nr:MAG: hypothetical protein CVU16_04230 [Betaproteobacteria bacterium HGW-Betaproteobacteria-10]
MARQLITSWEDYQTAIDRLLCMACEKICIYDEDLSQLKLNAAPRLAQILRVLKAGHRESLQIVVRNANLLSNHSPHLIKLLSEFSPSARAQQSPPDLAHLRDSLLIVDGKHALIRFERDLPRSKLLIDEATELKPYLNRLSELCAAGGDPVSTTTLGL